MTGEAAPQPPTIEPIAPDPELSALLDAAGLPTADLYEEKPLAFFGCRERGALVAAVGMEKGLGAVLLRSLAVAPGQRGRGLGVRLVAFVEHLAGARGAEDVYLLTDTASEYFAALGYRHLPRERAPDWIRAGAQFAQLCPAEAAFMAKSLTGR